MDTLEHRITLALSATAITSSELAALIEATEAAIVEADKIAEQERLKALDPTVLVDTQAASAAVVNAELRRDRLRAALPRLQQRYVKTEAAERYIGWAKDYAAIKAQRDAAAAELHSLYPVLAVKMSDLLLRIEVIDAKVQRVNATKPTDANQANGDGLYLHPVEIEARGPSGLDGTVLQRDVRLPHWRPRDGYAWPPHRLVLPFQLSEFEAKQIAEQQEQVRRRTIAVAEEVERLQAAE